MSSNFEKVFEEEKQNNQRWLQLRHCTEFICRKCFGDHRTRDCSKLMDNNQILTDINRICVYYDPFVSDPSKNTTCDSSCSWRHLTQDEFMNFCAAKIKHDPMELKKIAHEYFMHHNWMCLYYSSWQLMEEYPNNAKYIRLYARALDRLGDYEHADIYYRKAINGSATDDRSHREYAVFLFQALRKYSTAKDFFQNALTISNENPTTHCEYAQLLEVEEFEGRDYAKAELHYKKSLEIAPFHLKSLYYLALFYRNKMNNLDLSRKYFDKLCSLDYNYRTYWFHDHKLYSHHYFEYASLLKAQKDYGQAVFYFNIALEKVWPHMDAKADIYFNIGIILDECNGKNLVLRDHRGYPFNLQHESWYFKEASKLNPKMYSMFYNEYLQHHKFTKKGNDFGNYCSSDVRKTNKSYSKSTTEYNPTVSHSNITINFNKLNLNCQPTKKEKVCDSKEAFKKWIDGLQFDVDYYALFKKRGICSFESFYRIETINEVLEIIGKDKQSDAEIIWNTPTDF